MKRLSFSSVLVIVLSLTIVNSCSTEEDDTIASNAVQTPEPEPPAPTQYSLTVTAGEGGTVSTEGGTYDEGTEVTIIATPSEGYRFTGWEGNDSTSESLTITLNSNQTYQALFELIPPVQYTLTLTTSEGGTVSSEGGTYEEGTVVTITAIPSEGYSFVEWTDPYGSTWGSSNLNVTMFENRSFQAVFELIPIVDFNFNYYIDNNSLPESWITEFYTNQDYIRELLPIKSYVDQFREYKYVDGVDTYAWSSAAQRPSDFPDISGGCLCGFNDYESSSHIIMSLEVNNLIHSV